MSDDKSGRYDTSHHTQKSVPGSAAMSPVSPHVGGSDVGVDVMLGHDWLVTQELWKWDPTLYAGSARYYAQGRVPYSGELIERLAVELSLDGRGRLLDVGCGPGSLTLLLASYFERVTGLDADDEMLAEGARQAARSGVGNADWLHLRAEDLTSDLGPFRVATLAQSFHWMDRARVAQRLHGVLAAGGALVHLHATTHQGIESESPLPHPRPPRRDIDDLVKRYLGPHRRAGKGVLPDRPLSEPDRGRLEAEVYGEAGFSDRRRIEVSGYTVERTTEEVVASVFSLSSATPHLFADRLTRFEVELRALLHETSPDGLFSEEMRETAIDIWQP
jgi:SAM-dependent methyltransferase